MAQRCDKCGAAIPDGSLFYTVRIVLDQGFDGVIVVGPDDDLQSLVRRVERQTRGVPERLLEEDVHKELSFLLCPRCREKFAANPLNLPLDAGGVPHKLSDLES